MKAIEAARMIIRLMKSKLQEQALSAARKEPLYEGLNEKAITKLDDPQKAEEEDSIGRWVYDMGMVEELAKGPDDWSYEREKAKADEEAAAAQAAAAKPTSPWRSRRSPKGPGAESPVSSPKAGGPTTAGPGPAESGVVAAMTPLVSSSPRSERPQSPAGEVKSSSSESVDIFTAADTPTLRDLLHKAAKREEQLEDMLKEVSKGCPIALTSQTVKWSPLCFPGPEVFRLNIACPS